MWYGPFRSLRESVLCLTRGPRLNDINMHIARRLRRRRRLLGMTQQELGKRVGVRFQQIQKYESAANRINAEMLWKLSRALGVPVGYFYEGCDNLESEGDDISPTVLREPELVRLIKGYRQLDEPRRLRIVELVDAMN